MTRTALFSVPVLVGLLALAFGWHIAVGAKFVPPATVIEALFSTDRTNFNHVVVTDLRLPRAVYAIVVGAALAVAGALMQGITRNPLAEPGVLGLLAGASFAVVMAVGYFRVVDASYVPALAAAGAAGTAALVWAVASVAPGGSTPLTLILAGAAITGLLGALIALTHLLDQESFDTMRVWLTGTLAGRSSDALKWSLPWLAGGLVLALLMAPQVTAMAMGDEAAVGLGVDIARVKALAMTAVIALTAGAVAIAGPMGFVGLVIPHVARLVVGADYRAIIPVSALLGATYLLIVDIAARLVMAPTEISTGIVTALLGAPFFVWLVRARL